MLNETIAIYAIIDDLLKAIAHQEDCRIEMSDAEIITTAIIAAMFFDGNHTRACSYMKDHKLIPTMLEKSRFNRRLHRVSMLINDLFHQIGMILKEINDSTEYLLDSFPVAMCDNIRIFNVKLIKSEEYRGFIKVTQISKRLIQIYSRRALILACGGRGYLYKKPDYKRIKPTKPQRLGRFEQVFPRGYIASKKRYFYGVRVQLLTTKTGVPVEFVFMPGSASDVRGLNTLPLNLPPGSEVYSDSAYTDYIAEDNLLETSQIALKVMRKKNSKRQDEPWNQYIKQSTIAIRNHT